MKGLYITLGAIGGLVGVFVAGIVSALALGSSVDGGISLGGGRLAVVALGMVAAGIGIGLLLTALAQLAAWMWGRYFRT